MYRIFVLISALTLINCNHSDKVDVKEKIKTSVSFSNHNLINESYLAINFYDKYGTNTVWEDAHDRKQLIDFVLNEVEKNGFTLNSFKIKDLCLAHINYQNLSYNEQIQADLDFTHTFLQIIFNLEFGRINPKKFYSDWEVSKNRIVDVDYLFEALKEKNVKEYLNNKIPTNLFYVNLKKEYNKLNDFTSDKAKKIITNMERSRWLPDDLGQFYVWVNIPEERLRVFENGSETVNHRVIIGKPERRTPVLSSIFNQLVVNPTWTVPPTILKNDLVPKASANRGYFANQRLKIVDKNTGATVSPENWNPEKFNSYRYVQSTGNLNALGLIKFNFPNKHMVYLHDTNNRSMFNQANRALSSGCVRVEKPFDLAEKILSIEQSEITRSDLDTLVKKKKQNL